MKTIIYQYGCRLDKETLTETHNQFNLARGLYNAIIEHIRNSRDSSRQFIIDNTQALSDAEQILTTLNAQFKAAKAMNDEDAMQEIREQEKALTKETAPLWKEARKTNQAAISEFFTGIGKRSEQHTYQTRCKFVAQGLGSNTADYILDTALKAWAQVRVSGGKLAFRSAINRQQDHIDLRFNKAGGLPIQDLITREHAMLKLKTPAKVGDRQYGEFSFRLGCAKAEKYATGTWQYHRAFPDDAKVTTIRLVRKKAGQVYKWYLQFQLNIKEYPSLAITAPRKQFAALHLGFSLNESGTVRIGAIADHTDSGFAQFIDIPQDIHFDLYRSEQERSMRDTNRDNIHAAMKSLTPPDSWPDELKTEWTELSALPAQYVSASRIIRLSRRLEQAGFDSVLKAYAIHDYFKYISELGIQTTALNRRKNYYRELALALVKQYEVIAVSRLDLKKMALRIKETGERNELGQIARSARHSVALYSFIECLKWAAERAGTTVIEQTDLTYAHRCSNCSEPFTRETDLLICDHCGHETDIKANAAANLYQRLLECYADQATELKDAALTKAQAAETRKREKLARMQIKRVAKNNADIPASTL